MQKILTHISSEEKVECKALMNKLLIIDKDMEIQRTYSYNTILVERGVMSKPDRWQSIIEQLKVSKGDDLRSNLPAIIQMENYYP